MNNPSSNQNKSKHPDHITLRYTYIVNAKCKTKSDDRLLSH